MILEVLELNRVKQGRIGNATLVIDCNMTDRMLRDAMAIIYEELGAKKFIREANKIIE